MAIVEGCPAFSSGCPFSKLDADLLPLIMEKLPGNIRDKCPAFKDGCPFKDTDSVEELYNKLGEMPSTHQPTQNNPASKAVEETLRLVHTKSVELKSKFSSTCPVFATSCPFKTVTSYGAALIAELDAVVQRGALEAEAATPASSEEKPAEPLSKCLKSGTVRVHRSAENVHFVRDFLKGSVKKESYIDLLRGFYHVYGALEPALRDLPKHLQHCNFSVLERTDTLKSDLCYYLGSADKIGSPSPAVQHYVEHLQLLAKEDPLLLLAHAYTRYMGDLSGGQILSKAAAKTYSLPADKGVSFYRFDQVGNSSADLKAFKKAYRSSLDALQLSAKRADDLVQESNKAFLLNILLFEERDVAAGYLDRIHTVSELLAIIEANTSALGFQRAYGAKPIQTGGKIVSQCPFIPGPAGQRKEGEDSFHGDSHGACPWPFVWFHDPKSAIVSHPIKNAAGLATLLGLLRVAWHYPRRSAAVFIAAALALPWLKPKKQHKDNE